MRRLVYLLPLIAFVAIAAWFGIGLTRDPSRVPSALIDRPMPDFSLPAVNEVGVPGLSNDAIKGKVALVNIFASWCAPCKAENPILMRLAEEKRVVIYGINYKDRWQDARDYLKTLGNPYTAIGYDEQGRVGIDWGVYGVPETFIIDRAGRIRYKHIGEITPQALRDTLLPLIAQLEQK